MPNGLAIYESALTDVFGSRLCFGGPHALFTEVYRSRGGNFNSLEAILTKTASAYRQSPWTFICKGEPSSKDGVTALALELQTPPPKQEVPASLDAPLVEAPSLEVMLTSVEHPENLTLLTREGQPESPDAPLVEAPSLEVMLTSAEYQEPRSGSPTANDQIDLDPPSCSHPRHQGHPIEVHKSIIPLAKLKGLIDEIDIPDVQDARCETCANCPACKLSACEKTKSLQGEFEQDVIKKSVETNTTHGIVFANLPFLRDPVEYLTKKHGGNNNRYQAARIYQAQCKKPEFVREGDRKAHSDLVAKDSMSPISTFPLAEQEAILKRPVMDQLIPLKNMPNQTNFDRLTDNHFHLDTVVKIPKVLRRLYKYGIRKSVGRHTRTSAVVLVLFQLMMARGGWHCTRIGSTPTTEIKRDILIPNMGGRNRPLRARQKTGQVAHNNH
jgi:hypothetical protein